MSNIFGIPDNPLGDGTRTDSVRSRYCANLFISYPSVEHWRQLYDPRRTGDVRAQRVSYLNMKQHHQRSVLNLLDLVQATGAGKAVLADINGAPHRVLILPYDFQPSRFWRSNPESKVIAVTGGLTAQDDFETLRHGVPVCLKYGDGHVACVSAPGGGGRVGVFFEETRSSGRESADDVLLHELVHASREARGLRHQFPMTGGFVNKEEFFANLIENIHRVEKGTPPVAYGGQPLLNPKAFLDAPAAPPLRTVIATLQGEQRALFAALIQIAVFFNPIRQVDNEAKAYAARIERSPA